MSFEPDHFVGDGLHAFAEIWEADFREYWGLDTAECPEHLSDEDWKSAKILYSVACEFYDAAIRLQPGDLKVEGIVEILRGLLGEDPRDNGFVNQSLDVILTRNVGDIIYDQRRRAMKLIGFLVKSESERSREYLLRLARCYLYGMAAEGAVMARAVLDAAIQDLVNDHDVLSKGNAVHPRRVDLNDRLTHLKRERLISTEAWKAADSVRQNGNDAVHLAPGAVGDLDVTLGDLRRVLEELDGLRRAE